MLKAIFKGGDEVISLTGKSMDDVADIMGKTVTKTGKVQIGAGFRLIGKNGDVIATGGRWIDDIPAGAKLINKNAARSNRILRGISKADGDGIRLIPGFGTTARVGFLVGVGGVVWQTLSFTDRLSTELGDTITNYYGGNCAEDDDECIEKGAARLAWTGIAIIGIGAFSLISYFKPKKSSDKVEIKIETDKPEQAVGA